MKELKLSTARGRQIYKMGSHYEGYTLEQVYNKPSYEKQKAYDRCWNMYVSTENSTNFSICCYNTFMFTVSWLGTKDGEDIMRVETANNSYLVWLER